MQMLIWFQESYILRVNLKCNLKTRLHKDYIILYHCRKLNIVVLQNSFLIKSSVIATLCHKSILLLFKKKSCTDTCSLAFRIKWSNCQLRFGTMKRFKYVIWLKYMNIHSFRTLQNANSKKKSLFNVSFIVQFLLFLFYVDVYYIHWNSFKQKHD